MIDRPTSGRPGASDDLVKLGVDVAFAHGAGGDGVVEIAHHRTLDEDVGDDQGACHQGRLDLALVGAVGADRGDEGAGPDVIGAKIGLARRRAQSDHIARRGGRAEIGRGLGLQGAGPVHFVRQPAGLVAVAVPQQAAADRQHRRESPNMGGPLRPAAGDGDGRCVGTGEMAGSQRARRRRSSYRDLDRIHDGERRPRPAVAKEKHALDGRQPMGLFIVRKIAVELKRDIEPVERDPRPFGVEGAVFGMDGHWRRRFSLAIRCCAKGGLDGVEPGGLVHQGANVAP